MRMYRETYGCIGIYSVRRHITFCKNIYGCIGICRERPCKLHYDQKENIISLHIAGVEHPHQRCFLTAVPSEGFERLMHNLGVRGYGCG